VWPCGHLVSRGVDPRHQGHGAAGAGWSDRRAPAGRDGVEDVPELRVVPAADTVLGVVPGHGDLVRIPGQGGDAPVIVFVAVQVRHLDGGPLEVEPQVGFLARTEHAVHHARDRPARDRPARDRPAGEGHVHERHVRGRHGPRLCPGERRHLGPVPPGFRAACPSGGCRAPSWGRRRRCPTGPATGRCRKRDGAGSGTVLEDGGEPGLAAAAVRRGQFVELPQADRRRLLDEYAHPGAQAAEAQRVVGGRRRAHVHEVKPSVAEQVGQVAVALADAELQPERTQLPVVGIMTATRSAACSPASLAAARALA
jgi:hypothetical protein